MRAGLTMLSLATAVGISYQQVQKYEKGRDRLPAGHLYAFAQVLGCSPSFFFVGFDEGLIEQPDIDPGFPITREAQDLFKAYSSLDAASRKAVLRLLRLRRWSSRIGPLRRKEEVRQSRVLTPSVTCTRVALRSRGMGEPGEFWLNAANDTLNIARTTSPVGIGRSSSCERFPSAR